MRLPSWLRVRRTRRTGRTVTVELVADTRKFQQAMAQLGVTASVAQFNFGLMRDAVRAAYEHEKAGAKLAYQLTGSTMDWHSQVRYWAAVHAEQQAARKFLDDLLDGWCAELGVDPVLARARPPMTEEKRAAARERYRQALQARQLLAIPDRTGT